MKILFFAMFSFFSVVCVEPSAVQVVSGHVGSEVTIRCSPVQTSDVGSGNTSVYFFCKRPCSGADALIRSEGKMSAGIQQGRYVIESDGEDGAFNVTIKGLRSLDAGTYHCGVGEAFNVSYEEVDLFVIDAATVPPGSPPSDTLKARETPDRFFPPPSTKRPLAVPTLPASQDESSQRPVSKLKDTTVVIIVSVSLAIVVCAFIPLIFYGHCRSTAGGSVRPEENKNQGNFSEEVNAASAKAAVRLESLEAGADPEAYAAVYQALDPKGLD